ncbi:MAG: HU family DNA-binding protein [Verrucomicrobiales bacterium]
MNKAELIESVQQALGGDTSKREATDALEAVLGSIANGVRRDQVVQIIGFGSFKVSNRAARMGRNPKTGEPMQISASKSVRFSPSSALKKSL